MKTVRLCTLTVASLLGFPLCAAGAGGGESGSKPYRVVDGKVDDTTFRGWRAYHSACHTCHGVDGTGTTVAPNLVESIKNLSERDFVTKVITSYRIVIGAGEIRGDDKTAIRESIVEQVLKRESGDLVMPAWEQNETVRPHVLDIYAYLRARADGVLGPGRPRRLTPTSPAKPDKN